MVFQRYVAIGDSTVEGLDDPDGRGGYRGWADRLADHIAAVQGSLHYANLGVRGRTTRQIREEQLAPALAMNPDLAVVVCGTNDLLRRRFDPSQLRDDILAMQRAFTGSGATVITFTMPDLSAVMPLARLLHDRLDAMNEAIRIVSASTGTIVCDFARYPVTQDPRLWSDDRLHANSVGHERIAAGLAYHLKLPGTDMKWAEPLAGDPPRGLATFIRAEGAWVRRHLAPWLWRHARGRSSGDGVRPKRSEMTLWGAGLS